MAVKLNKHDLEFVLKQIKIAEANSTAHAGNAAVGLADVRIDANGNYGATGALALGQPHLPYGLRTVDGSYNNLIEGRELWGASDQVMPRMLDASYTNGQAPANPIDINGPMAPGGEVTNTDYGAGGDVVDVDPRIITNLISDQTLNNPAAIMAALQHAEYPGDMLDAVDAIRAAHQAHVDHFSAIATTAANNVLGPFPPAPVPAGVIAARKAAVEEALETAGYEQAKADLYQSLADTYNIAMDGTTNSIVLPNVAPDEGLSAPFNGWMTFFGQFFDHGLDLIHKGDNGTIFVPLAADDPLRTHGPDGIAGSGDEVPDHLAWMAVTRLKPEVGPDGTMEAKNKTTPYVDQNQTYTSHASHQVFLREYAMVDDMPMATGRLLNGANGGLATWADVKTQAREKLGIELTDYDMIGVPLLRTDAYGEFIRDANGFPQVIYNIGPDLIPNTADDLTASGTSDAPLNLLTLNNNLGPVRTSHQFLDDIAHAANPFGSGPSILQPDIDTETDSEGNPLPQPPAGTAVYDNELLDSHFITGDGRGNENIGLTTVHHVFHAEHNRQTASQKLEIIESGDLDFINEWMRGHGEAGGANLTEAQLDDLLAMPKAELYKLLAGDNMLDDGVNPPVFLPWDGERIFQAARFATEMQYQHLVFEEFGRKVQPNIDLFVFNTVTDVNPAIFAEFAHTVYRFGHSMLTDHIKLLPLNAAGQPVGLDGLAVPNKLDENGDPILDANGNPVPDLGAWDNVDVGLIEAFLNPVMFDSLGTAEQAAGAIVRGLTYVHGNAIDEFVVESLRNNLLGLPLDLAAINIARGRDAGVPSLNEARAQLYAASNSTWLKPYESWADFAANLKTPASIINFVAAYGTHASIANATTMAEKRDAAMELLFGRDVNGDGIFPSEADRQDFLHARGAYTTLKGGLDSVDLWIGGLAEKVMPFGGMLGSTFNAVFELQMENLQEGDRFYYLSRTQGLNLLNELEDNAFAKIIMANSDLATAGADGIHGTDDDVVKHHIGIDSFAKYDGVLEIDPLAQIAADTAWGENDPFLEAIRAKVQRDDPNTSGTDTNYIRFTGGEHMVIGGTAGNDRIIGGDGDDGIWGGDGDDDIESGHGVDLVVGGAGDDVITDSGDTGDFLKGSAGDDVIANSNGLDVLMGGDGKDVFFAGVDATEIFGGEGDDFMLGGLDHDFMLGNEGDDWMEGGDGFDVLNGDNSELFFNSTILGHDVAFAGANENDFDMESGDDIMVQGESVMRNEGMYGFDWAIYKGSDVAADADMRIPFFTTVADDILRDRFDQVEAISGWELNDIIRGDDRGSTNEIEVEFDMANHELSWAGVDRIDGLQELLGLSDANRPAAGADMEKATAWTAGNLLIGGDGNDLIEGRGADDFIHGDAWLNVRIRIVGTDDNGVALANNAANERATVDTLTHIFNETELVSLGLNPNLAGKSLSELLLTRVIKPSQMHIQREIKYDEDASGDTDTAIFAGNRDWYEITHLGTDARGNEVVRVARREMEEIDPAIDEGTDTLVGIERILFADSIYTIRETGNHDPVGRLTIGGLPAKEGEPLTVDALALRDLNNPDGLVPESAISYRWQVERNDGTGDYIDIPGARGNTFTPDDDHVGLRIRVLGMYTDGGGVNEVVMSYPTDVVENVNDAPTGEVLLSDMTPTEGQTLTATLAINDPDGITDAFEEFLLTYFWESSANPTGPWTEVASGPDLRSFTPGPELVGRYLRMRVEFTDDGGELEEAVSAATEIVGNRISVDLPTIDASNGDAQGGTNDGADWVVGGNGANIISGGDGGDYIHGGGGGDTINGDAGDDVLNGGAGNDTIDGDAGNDRIIYQVGGGTDTVDGGDGHDTFRVEGTSGNDAINVVMDAAGVIELINGTTLESIEAVEIEAFPGIDTLTYDTTAAVAVDLLTGAATGMSFIRGIENVTSGSGNDTLQGNSLGNRLDGGAGNDLVRGGFGNDNLLGGIGNDDLYGDEGDDVLEGGVGNDRIDGGAGNDTASYANANGAVTVSLTGTATRASFEEQDTGNAGLDRLVSIENLTGSAYNDALTGDAGNNVIDGGAGADAMDGGTGNDTYVVENVGDSVTDASGNDTVMSALNTYTLAQNVENLVLIGSAVTGIGNELDNRLTGNAGANTLNGAGGDDTVVLAGTHEAYTFGLSGGNVTVTGGGSATDTLVSIENAEIGGVNYNIVPGTNGNDASVSGGGEADLVLGFDGDDTLTGGGGDDILKGGSGNDNLSGGAGDDILDGGENGAAGVTPGTFIDNFNGTASYSDNDGTAHFSGTWANWTENNDDASPTGGDIRNESNVLRFRPGTDNNDSIQRSFSLAGTAGAALTFGYTSTGVDAGEGIRVEAFNGSTWDLLGTLEGNSILTFGTFEATLSAAHSAIRFVAFGGFESGGFLGLNNDTFNIDNVEITPIELPNGDMMAGGDGDDTYYVDSAGDQVNESSGANSGTDTVILTATGNYTLGANVENLVVQGGGTRTLSGNGLANDITGGTGNDTINGGGGNDTLIGGAGNDTLNGQGGTDTAVFEGSAGDYTFGLNGAGTTLATVSRLGVANDTDTLSSIEQLRFGDGPVLDIVTGDGDVTANSASIIIGGGGNDTITGSNGNDVIIGGAGDDTLNGHFVGLADDDVVVGILDDDTYLWRAGAGGFDDGQDFIDGGGEGVDGDTFQVIGNGQAETYRIYTEVEAVARGFALAGEEPEIFVTRQVAGGEETVIAQLIDIEEIVINGMGVSGADDLGDGDRVEMYGDFSVTTSLRPDTVTIIGSDGNDTVDISSLQSAHRILFKTGGGHDVIIGNLRPQDVVELPDGKTLGDYEVTIGEDGQTLLDAGDHKLSFYATLGMPTIVDGDVDEDDEDDDDDDHHHGGPVDDDNDQPSDPDDDDNHGSSDDDEDEDEDDDDVSCESDDEEEDDGPSHPTPVVSSGIVGTEAADALVGTDDGETIMGLGGRDVIFGHGGDDDILGGDGADMLYGDGGADRILGGNGIDMITGGSGSDTVFGGNGDDIIVAKVGDGNDTYYGGDIEDAGIDTLDMSAITAAITADLGNGFQGRGHVSSSESGSDTIWGVENFVGGWGNDDVTASTAVNVMDGGDGNDVFRFLSAEHANGDTIVNFQPGDKIDLSAIDADRCASGTQSFSLVSDAFTGRGQIMVTQETINGEDYTVVLGNTTGGTDADFRLNIKGSHELDASDFNL